MKRILITGANSYLGKSLTEYLKQWPDEFQVEATRVRDALLSQCKGLTAQDITIVEVK